MKSFLAFFLSASLTVPAFAQGPVNTTQQRKRQRGPRAIAVIRWQADEQGNGHPVLLPVAIRDEGRIFDASVYKTSPRPMAIEPDTVYEAAQHGQPIGLFTIVSATRASTEDRNWIGLGRWQPNAVQDQAPKKDVQEANMTIGTPKASSAQMQDVPEGEQKRKTTQVYDESGRPVDNPKDDEPPTMTKGKREPIERSPRVSAPEKKPAPPTSTTPDDDPDRPRLKKGAPSPATSAAAKPITAEPDTDPNRPILKRGRPDSVTRISNPAENSPVPREVISRAAVTKPRVYELVAVSDADQSLQPQSYNFNSTLAERQAYLRKMEDLVDAELKPKTTSTASKLMLRKARAADPSRFAEMRFEILDLDYNNSPEMVLTGSYVLSASDRVPFVLVARGDYEGNPRTLMFEKGDRFEFIDAVDIDGDGPGELLFRRIAPNGAAFVIYRATPDGLNEIFHGGAAD